MKCPVCGTRIDPRHTNPSLCFGCGWTDAEVVQQARLPFDRARPASHAQQDSKMAAAGEKDENDGAQ